MKKLVNKLLIILCIMLPITAYGADNTGYQTTKHPNVLIESSSSDIAIDKKSNILVNLPDATITENKKHGTKSLLSKVDGTNKKPGVKSIIESDINTSKKISN